MIVDTENTGKRLDVFLAATMGYSRAKAQDHIDQGEVQVNGKVQTKASLRVQENDEVVRVISENTSEERAEEHAKAPLVFPSVQVLEETQDYLVINKPAGLLIHPTQADEPISVASWLQQRYPHIHTVGGNDKRGGIVHRLDKDTSGVLVVAKTNRMFDWLKKQFRERVVEKEYMTLVHGIVSQDQGIIDFTMSRGTGGRMVARPKVDDVTLAKVKYIQEGKEARTEFFVEKRYARFTLLRVLLHTGRTHQIRVHFFAYNHPVVGDMLYIQKKLNRKRDKELGRLFLHARRLCFETIERERVCYEAELPKELKVFLQELN